MFSNNTISDEEPNGQKFGIRKPQEFQDRVSKIADHFGLNVEKVKSELMVIWRHGLPRSRRAPSAIVESENEELWNSYVEPTIVDQLKKQQPRQENAQRKFLLDIGLKKRKTP